MQGNAGIDQFLQTIEQPSPQASQVRKTWANKPTEEIVAGGRKLLYGVVSRALHGDPTALEELQSQPELVQEIEAYFECVFQKAEETSMGRSRRASSGSSSS